MLQAAQGAYRMHDLLRQYAAEKLAADEADASRVRDAHSAYYLERLAERGTPPEERPAQRSLARDGCRDQRCAGCLELGLHAGGYPPAGAQPGRLGAVL